MEATERSMRMSLKTVGHSFFLFYHYADIRIDDFSWVLNVWSFMPSNCVYQMREMFPWPKQSCTRKKRQKHGDTEQCIRGRSEAWPAPKCVPMLTVCASRRHHSERGRLAPERHNRARTQRQHRDSRRQQCSNFIRSRSARSGQPQITPLLDRP